MTKDFDYRILVKVSPNASLTITTVLSAPRQCAPQEVLVACQNIELTAEPAEFPLLWLDFASFVLKEFFSYAHRTGLYNRQHALWRAIGRIVEVRIVRPQTGLFTAVDEPYADFSFYDARANRIVWATLLDGQPKDARSWTDKGLKHFINDSIKRAEKIQKKEGNLSGLFIGMPGQISAPVLDVVARLTGGAADPVGRYEALLPAPMNISLDLVSFVLHAGEEKASQFALAYPILKAKSGIGT
jgi:hypothetical protein